MTANNSIIPVFSGNIQNQSIQLVNARQLHGFLEVGKDFTTWIKDRINQYGFIENQDYVCIEVLSSPKSVSAKARPQKLTEYHITLDMAKELSMVERNAKGKEARLYFIECEKQARKHEPKPTQPKLSSVSSEFKGALRLAKMVGLSGNQAILSANKAVKSVTGVDTIALLGVELTSPVKEIILTPTEIGKEIGLSAVKVNLKLESIGLQAKVGKNWMPTDKAAGKFEVLDTNKRHSDGTPVKQVKWFSSVIPVLKV